MVPFWKQWNALLQINVEKNKHKHNGIYVVPASAIYYPSYDGYGLYVPHNFGGLAHGTNFQPGYRPMPLLFDDYKTMATTVVCFFSISAFISIFDKNRFMKIIFYLQNLQFSSRHHSMPILRIS